MEISSQIVLNSLVRKISRYCFNKEITGGGGRGDTFIYYYWDCMLYIYIYIVFILLEIINEENDKGKNKKCFVKARFQGRRIFQYWHANC